MTMLLRMTSRLVDGVTVVDLVGELSRSGPSIYQPLKELLERGRFRMVLNMSGVRYVDSSGLSQLIAIWTSAANKDGQLILLQPTSQVHTQLRMTKLDTVFTILQDEQEAVRRIQ